MNQTKSSTTKGIISVICAGFFFALMTFFVRLSGDLPTMEKAFFRNAVAALVSLPFSQELLWHNRANL